MLDQVDRAKRLQKWNRTPCTRSQQQTIARLATQLPNDHDLVVALGRLPVRLSDLSKLNAAVWIDSLRDAFGLTTSPI